MYVHMYVGRHVCLEMKWFISTQSLIRVEIYLLKSITQQVAVSLFYWEFKFFFYYFFLNLF